MNTITFLKGKKTYFCALLALLYITGSLLGFYDCDAKVLSALGFGGLAFLRHGFERLNKGPGIEIRGNNSVQMLVESRESNLSAEDRQAVDEARLRSTGNLELLFCAAVLVLGGGCAMQRVVEIDPATKVMTRYTGLAFLNKSALEGLAVGKRTKTTSQVFSLQKGNTETQGEAITALAEAVGNLAGAAAKAAVKP
ncbi:MAG TPA: hypothetical protein VK633_06370 [Verrucomicrobiae bacterium]|nr:hypothetical protein [Verrucomicrobiae bacterium]